MSEPRWWRTYDTGHVEIVEDRVLDFDRNVVTLNSRAITDEDSVPLSEASSHPDVGPLKDTTACEFWNDGHSYYDIYCAIPPAGAEWTEL